MHSNQNVRPLINENAILPILSFIQGEREGSFDFLGTGFFVTHDGWFITAKHVVCDSDNNVRPTIYGIQSLSDQTRVFRVVTNIISHTKADFAMGKLGDATDVNAKPVQFEPAPTLSLSLKSLYLNDKIFSYGYPDTKKTIEGNLHTLHFKAERTQGVVERFFPNGFALVRYKRYMTSMPIAAGSSGGPVFKDIHVVGINSSAMNMEEGERPLSFITPVSTILDFKLPIDDTSNISVGALIKKGLIKAIY